MKILPSEIETIATYNIDDYISIDEYRDFLYLPEGAAIHRDERIPAYKAVKTYLYHRAIFQEERKYFYDCQPEKFNFNGYVQSVTEIVVYMGDGTETIQDSEKYHLRNIGAENGQVYLVDGYSWSFSDKTRDKVSIQVVEGWTPDNLPPEIKSAILMVASQMYASDGTFCDVSLLPQVCSSISQWANIRVL